MRCLGLDLGTRTLGLAISDKTNFIASPFKTLRWDGNDYNLLFSELDNIIKEYNITHLVLGLPKNMDNTLGFASERSLKFKEALEDRYKLKVVLIDERLSTVEAENYLIDNENYLPNILRTLWKTNGRENVHQPSRYVIHLPGEQEVSDLVVDDPHENLKRRIYDAIFRIVPEGFKIMKDISRGDIVSVIATDELIKDEWVEKAEGYIVELNTPKTWD